jgi:hypothetical protein
MTVHFMRQPGRTIIRDRLTTLFMSATLTCALLLVPFSSAGAATWSQWHRTCAKWVLDVPKVDRSVSADLSPLNFTYLVIDFAGLAVDGQHIKACANTPDRTLNSLLTGFGGALYSAGLQCAGWAQHRGSTSVNPCYAALQREKAVERQLDNRMGAIG